jgi:hypothetical protein
MNRKDLIVKRKRIKNTANLLVLLSLLIFPFSPLGALLYLLMILAGLYTFGFFLHTRKSSFKCSKCGICCHLRVTPKEKDLGRIEKAGHNREEFLDGKSIKLVNSMCFFLRKKGDQAICSIHKHRPDICRKWPFHDMITISNLAICPDLRKLLKK